MTPFAERPGPEQGVVIVGAGHGGIETAEALRREGFDGPIMIIDGASHLPYQRPPLSKDYVQPDADPSPLPLRGERFYADHGITLRLGQPVTAIDPVRRCVGLGDGGEIGYHDLVLATGAHVRRATCDGAGLDGVLTLRTVDDAARLRTALDSASEVVVVGAGFIGLEFASAARQHGLPVTVLDVAERPMQRVLSPGMSDHFRELHEAAGARLVFGEGLAALDGTDGRVSAVIGSSGTRYPADLVVLGLGITPADELAREAGLMIDNGIAVDQHLRSSDPHIFAIGDCASYPSVQGGRRLRLEAVQNAVDHARCVARTIAGTPEPYAVVPWFWTVQCGRKLQIAGLADPEMSMITIGDLAAGKASSLGFVDDQLVCVESLGAPADHLAARKILSVDNGLTPQQAAAPDFSLKSFQRAMADRAPA